MSEDTGTASVSTTPALPPHPSRPPPSRPARSRTRFAVALAAFALVVASTVSLEPSFAALFEPGSLRALAELAAGFVPPTHDAAFARRLAEATGETLAMSLVGTALGALVALPLALTSARLPWRRDTLRPVRHGRAGRSARIGSPVAGGTVPLRNTPGSVAGTVLRMAANGLLVALRSVPELVWAALLLVVVGIGPASGTLALALHTAGVLGRLQAETLENLPPETAAALHANGASPIAVFVHGALPLALPRLASWTLYRWESNIRIAALLGLVGAGGLGQMLHVNLSLFRMHDAASVILATLVLVVLVDAASFRLRRHLTR